MKSIQVKITVLVSTIMLVMAVLLLFTSALRTTAILNDDSEDILRSAADYYTNLIDDNYRSTEQSVATIYNYAAKLAAADPSFLGGGTAERRYTDTISELSVTIAENTLGAMAVYLRYNPDDFGGTGGFWYNVELPENNWVQSVPTDLSLYASDDIEHVGWYFVPVRTGEPMWMEPYHNANIGVDMISYIIPFYYGDYTVGIIGMDINLELLRSATAQVQLYDSGHAFMLDRRGNVIYHEAYPAGMEFSRLPETDRDYFARALSCGTSAVTVGASRTGAQEKLILRELRNGMLLGVYAPLNEIDAPRINLLTWQVLIAAAILLISILICRLLVKSVADPLKKMTSVAEHYAAGDFSEEMQVSSNDEVGILSRSLQTMSASLQQQIVIADSANRAKSAFLSNMSHEIRTPINAVLGLNEMILRESGEPNVPAYAESVRTAGGTLLSIINDILDFSKIEAGKMEIIPVDYDLSSVINDLVNMIQTRVDDKGLVLRLDFDETMPRLLRGDEVRIKQVITNILTNAVKYTEKGSVTFRIGFERIPDEPDGVILCVTVQDTGIGIKPEDLKKLFSEFERIEEKRNRNIEGTGLGTNITRSLLEMMGSSLHVESVYGEGSTFSFRLRQDVVKWEALGNCEEAYRASRAKRAKYQEKFTAPDAQVLVVDDTPMNLMVIKSLLSRTQVRLDLANSGDGGLLLAYDKKYDLIFLDHMMPEKDGIETLHELKARKNGPNLETPTICLTANAISGAREKYLAEGFIDYLTKPIDSGKLEEMMMRYLPQEKQHITRLDEDEADGPAEPEAPLFAAGIDGIDAAAAWQTAARRIPSAAHWSCFINPSARRRTRSRASGRAAISRTTRSRSMR